MYFHYLYYGPYKYKSYIGIFKSTLVSLECRPNHFVFAVTQFKGLSVKGWVKKRSRYYHSQHTLQSKKNMLTQIYGNSENNNVCNQISEFAGTNNDMQSTCRRKMRIGKTNKVNRNPAVDPTKSPSGNALRTLGMCPLGDTSGSVYTAIRKLDRNH